MLSMDPSQRPTANEALKSPWICGAISCDGGWKT